MVGNTSISIGSASELVEDTTPREHSPGTLGFALACESDGLGHVEFRDGVSCWVAGPARFPSSEAA